MRHRLLPLILLCGLVSSCGFDDLDLSAIDIGLGKDEGDSIIEAGAKDFVSCNLGKECNYLWEQARIWLDENAPFRVDPKNETTFTAYSPAPDKHRTEVQYRVSQIEHPGGIATIKVEAFCSDMDACEDTAVEQVYKLNEYLRRHKRALAEDLISLEGYEEPELPRATQAAPADDDTLADLSMQKEYRRGPYQSLARDALAGEGCLKQSKMSLLKSGGGEDLYEVDCLTGIRRVVFRCTRDGCTTLE